MFDGQTSQPPLRHSAIEQESSLYILSNETGTEEAQLGYRVNTAKLTEWMAIFAEGREISRTRLNLNIVVKKFPNQCDSAILEGVAMKVRLGNPIPEMIGDSNLISQARRNLWQNVIDSMPERGSLS